MHRHHDPNFYNCNISALNQLITHSSNLDHNNMANIGPRFFSDHIHGNNFNHTKGHYVGRECQSSSTLNVNSIVQYDVCSETNINYQWNTNIADGIVHPNVGNIYFCNYQCHSTHECWNYGAVTPVLLPVLCAVDIMLPLETVYSCQVVYLHDPKGRDSGFYYLWYDQSGNSFFHICDAGDIGPLHVVGKVSVNVVFCSHSTTNDMYVDLTPEQVYHDYNKDLWSHVTFNMDYTQYMECVIDELCMFMDLQCSSDKLQLPDALVDASDTGSTPNSITALLHDTGFQIPQVDHDAYIKGKNVGFLSHDNVTFEFIGPDRPPVLIDSIGKCIEVANIVRSTGVPNYKCARIPIVSKMNVEAWEDVLSTYPDGHLLQYIKFGFPLSINRPDSLKNTTVVNHHSAIQYPQAVAKYIKKEQGFGTILGPSNYIADGNYHCSPLLTRPKDTNDRRVILNLSHPKGQSVNDCVDKVRFDGRSFTLKFPSVDDIVERILEVEDPLLFKIDVARAFRNLRVDPVDALKFGLCWDDALYVDAGVAFGWTHGSAAFQMVADAISYVMASSGCVITPYIDDFIVVAPRDQATKQFDQLSGLLDKLGLPMNPAKKTPPCDTLTCLGITVSIPDGTLSIAPDKLHSIHEACCQVATKKFLSKKSYQSLLGKLIYIHKCVSPARSFINRILALFRNNSHKSRIYLTEDFFKDIQWFIKFLPAFNSVTFFRKVPIPKLDSLHLDACLSGLGAIWNGRVYSTPVIHIPNFPLTIVHLEMWNIVIALRMWGHLWRHSSIHIFCDNLAVVQVIKTHKTKDAFLAICDRNAWLLAASYDILLQVDHVRGKDNAEADLLSRLHSGSPVDPVLLNHLSKTCTWDKVSPEMFKLDFNI